MIQDIPLLFMILSGSLSFVGTQIININSDDPHLLIKPGLTGLAHLKTGDLTLEAIRKFEQYYALNYSLVFDIEILLKSVFKL